MQITKTVPRALLEVFGGVCSKFDQSNKKIRPDYILRKILITPMLEEQVEFIFEAEESLPEISKLGNLLLIYAQGVAYSTIN